MENSNHSPRPSQTGAGGDSAAIKSEILDLIRSKDLKKKIQDIEAQDEIWLIAAVCAEAAATHIGNAHGDLQERLNQALGAQSSDVIKKTVGDEVEARLTRKIQELTKTAIGNAIGEEFEQLSGVLSKSLERSADKIAKSIQPASIDSDAISRAIQRPLENALEQATHRAAEKATGRVKSLRDSLGLILSAAALAFALAGYAAGVLIERSNTMQLLINTQLSDAAANKTKPATR